MYKTNTRFYNGDITIYIRLFVSSRSTYIFIITLLCIRNGYFISTELSLTMNTLFIGTNLPIIIFDFFSQSSKAYVYTYRGIVTRLS